MTEHLEPPSAGRDDHGWEPSVGPIHVSTQDPQRERSSAPVSPAIRPRELLIILAIVGLADITIFRGTGYAGGALFLVLAPVLLLGSPAPKLSAVVGGLGIMIWILAARLIWQGAPAGTTAGFLLLTAFAMSLSGRTPFVLGLLGFALKAWIDAVDSIGAYEKWLRQRFRYFPNVFSLQWILPVVAVVVFGGIFIAANPDLVQRFREGWVQFLNQLQRWWEVVPISPGEVVFCIAVGWYIIGILRPSDWSRELEAFSSPPEELEITAAVAAKDVLTFSAYRNTVIAVSVLFAVYLVYEFKTLWFRTFEKEFHYSGFAHEGAAWLTVALALATVILSVIFRGRMLQDPRLSNLRRWVWIWSVENLILALAVYNRLWIYVGFNGMTRMRVVALLGISSVVVGFLLVLWKIAHNRGFVWLLRRHILTVTLAAYLYVVTPVDWLVYSYNVRRILAGDPAPSVQITEHEVSDEGILTLSPLLNCSDPIIRDGIHSLLTERARTITGQYAWDSSQGWTSYQMVNAHLSQRLRPLTTEADTPELKWSRAADWDRFRAYAYQWY